MGLVNQTIAHVQGASFAWGAPVQLPGGTWTATAHLRKLDDTLIATLTAAVTAPAVAGNKSVIKITAAASSTGAWAVGDAILDIKFVNGGAVAFSVAVLVQIKKAVTHA